MKKVKVWDLQTRIFHWLLVVYILCALVLADMPGYLGFKIIDSDAWLGFHIAAGSGAGVLFAFRILWGFAGPYYSRFSSFRLSIKELIEYAKAVLKNKKNSYTGHNPGASWAAIGIITIGLFAVLTGIVVFGIDERRGILKFLYTDYHPYVNAMKFTHHLLAYLLLSLIIIHISGVLLETIRHKTGIITAMFTGKKNSGEPERKIKPNILLTAISFLWVISPLPLAFYLYNSIHSTLPTKIIIPAVYKKECSTCHMAFPPNVLPAESWQAIMSDLKDHFGDDASLDELTRKEVEAFLIKNSAENSTEEASFKLLRSIEDKNNPPIRITEIAYWKKKHKDIKPDVYEHKSITSRINCSACHKWAEYGSFEDSDIRIPR